MKKTFRMATVLLALLALTNFRLWAQAPSGYYDAASGKTGTELRAALHDIIDEHTTISYAHILNAFWSTDNKGNGVVWDMYSDGATYTYQLGQDNCSGSCTAEAECYNREHSWPQSWFNQATTPTTDLHHVFPTDCYVNQKRSSYPFGEVQTASWTSLNGSKLGSCKSSLGYNGTVFEPIDEYKGDFARAIMYMSVRYYGEDDNWGTSGMTNKSDIKDWAIAMLLSWNESDPVSQKEIDRNNAIYNNYQHNRNPFIDNPEYARMIWDPNWVGTTYNITCATGLQHGSISAPAMAFVGSTVTLTATPETGYMLDTWTVYKTGDPSTTVTMTGNTFTMPEYNVTVSATFKVNTTKYNITCASGLSHGSISANPTSAMSGTTITLSNTPTSGYTLYSYYVYKTGDINTIVYSGLSNTFTMPAFDVTVSASFAQGGNYEKVTSAPSDWSGEYLIVYEGGSKAFNGGLTTLDATNNTISVTINSNSIASTTTTDAATFTIAKSENSYSIKSASGYYIGRTSSSNGMNTSTTQQFTNTISISNGTVGIAGSAGPTLQFNSASDQNRFRYFTSSQQPIQLYKKTASTASTPTHTIQFKPNGSSQSSYTQIVNEFEPTALQANAFSRSGYAFDSWNTAANGSGTTYYDGATVTLLNDLTFYAQWDPTYAIACASVSNGSISASVNEAVEGAIVTLTATPNSGYDLEYWTVTTANNEPVDVEGDRFVMPASSVTISAVFTEVGQSYTQKYYLVTDASQLVEGRTYLVVCTSKNKAMGPQSGNVRQSENVTISNNSITNINGVSELVLGRSNDLWTLWDGTGYLCARSNTNNQLLTQTELDNEGRWAITINENNEASIVAQGSYTHNILRYGSSNNYFSCFQSGATAVSLFIRSEEYDYAENTTLACLNTFDKTTVRSGATLTATTVLGMSQCNNAGQIILEDGAQLIHTTTGVNATVKKLVTAYSDNGGWYTLATPFSTYNPANTTMVSNEYDLYAYDEDGDNEGKEWLNYKAGSFDLTAGQGYLYAHNPTLMLRMAGTLNNGNYTQTVNLSYANSDATQRGFNLLGNPTAHDITFTKSESVSDGYYYLNNDETWAYTPSTTVPVGRGFMVKANATGQTVTLNPQSKGENTDKGQYLCINIGEEQVYIKLNEGKSMPLLNLQGQHASLYLTRDGQPYVMLVRDDAAKLDLSFKARRRGEQTLTVDAQGLALDYLHLIDNLTGANIDLLITPEYTFDAAPTDYAARFQLVFSVSQTSEPTEGPSCFAYVSNGQIVITGLEESVGTAWLQIIDATGRMLSYKNVSHVSAIPTTGMSKGVYILRLITADAVRVQKIEVK